MTRFWKSAYPGTVLSTIATIIITGLTLILHDSDTDQIRYQRAFFATLAPQSAQNPTHMQYDKDPEKIGRDHALVLKKKHAEGRTFEDISRDIESIQSTVKYFAGTSNYENIITKLKEFIAQPPDFQLFSFAKTAYWQTFSKQPHDGAVIAPLLNNQSSEIPRYLTADPPINQWWLIWIPLMLIQFCTFGAYLVGYVVHKSNYPRWSLNYNRWFHFHWGIPGTYITMLILLPGALPLMAGALFGSICTMDLGATIARRREARRAQPTAKKSAPSSDLDYLRSRLER